MPRLPWCTVQRVEPETLVTVMASRLPLKRHRAIPSFLSWTLRIHRQLARDPGFVRYALDEQFGRKTFWTVSAWRSARGTGAFDRAEPHSRAVASIRPHRGKSAFVTWTTRAMRCPSGGMKSASALQSMPKRTRQDGQAAQETTTRNSHVHAVFTRTTKGQHERQTG